jgi:hypothetical protein
MSGVCTLVVTCWVALLPSPDNVARLPSSNVAPLAFGMTPGDAANAIGSPLVAIKGRRGNEVFVADVDAGVPGLYPVGARLYLQFRHNRLTGWKIDRRLVSGWLF